MVLNKPYYFYAEEMRVVTNQNVGLKIVTGNLEGIKHYVFVAKGPIKVILVHLWAPPKQNDAEIYKARGVRVEHDSVHVVENEGDVDLTALVDLIS